MTVKRIDKLLAELTQHAEKMLRKPTINTLADFDHQSVEVWIAIWDECGGYAKELKMEGKSLRTFPGQIPEEEKALTSELKERARRCAIILRGGLEAARGMKLSTGKLLGKNQESLRSDYVTSNAIRQALMEVLSTEGIEAVLKDERLFGRVKKPGKPRE